MFNVIHHASQFKADIFVAAMDPLHRWALQHRRRIELSGNLQTWVAPPEYVILRKLEYFRESSHKKHLRDVRFMLAATPELDQPFIDAQMARLGLQAQWRIVQEPGEPRFPAIGDQRLCCSPVKRSLSPQDSLMFNQGMERFLGRFSPGAFAVLRIISGLLMACHGGAHVFGMFEPKMQAPLGSLVGVGGAIELIGGFLVAFGLFGGFAAFILSGQMAFAYFMMHAKGGFFPIVNHGEAAVLYCFIFLYIACHGSGAVSIDQMQARRLGVAPSTSPRTTI